MNRYNSGIQNSHLQKSNISRLYGYLEKGASDYAKKVNKRKPFYMAGKESHGGTN